MERYGNSVSVYFVVLQQRVIIPFSRNAAGIGVIRNIDMGKNDKLIQKVLSGKQDTSLSFSDLTHLLLALGFSERIRGSHHIYTRSEITEIINIQPNGSQAKPYQVKQIRDIITKYQLEVSDE